MSTKHNAMYAYALYLDEEAVRHMYAQHFGTNSPNALYEAMFDLYAADLIEYESDFTGEAVYLDDHGRPEWGCIAESYYAESLAYVLLPEQPTLLKGAYTNMDAAARDMQLVMDGLLPDDFNYRDNLCLILGTYYG